MGKIYSNANNLLIHYRDKRQIKEIFDVAKNILGIFWGTFTAHEI
jgi:hypothetical protein